MPNKTPPNITFSFQEKQVTAKKGVAVTFAKDQEGDQEPASKPVVTFKSGKPNRDQNPDDDDEFKASMDAYHKNLNETDHILRARKASWKQTKHKTVAGAPIPDDFTNYSFFADRFISHIDRKHTEESKQDDIIKQRVAEKTEKHTQDIADKGYIHAIPEQIEKDDKIKHDICKDLRIQKQPAAGNDLLIINKLANPADKSSAKKQQTAVGKTNALKEIEFTFTTGADRNLDQDTAQQVIEHLAEVAANTKGTIEISGCGDNLRAALDLAMYSLASMYGSEKFYLDFKVEDGTKDLIKAALAIGDDDGKLTAMLTKSGAPSPTPEELKNYSATLVQIGKLPGLSPKSGSKPSL